MVDRLIFDHKNNEDVTNVLYNKAESINFFFKKLDIFNPEADEPLQKFWFHIEKAKLLKKKQGKIDVVIFNKDKQLVKCIGSLDQKVNKITKKLYGVKNHYESLEIKDGFPPMIELEIDGETVAFNADEEMVRCYDIKNGSNISLYIELEGVYISGGADTKRWRVLQMKENVIVDNKKSFFSVIRPPPSQQVHPAQQMYNPNPGMPMHPLQMAMHQQGNQAFHLNPLNSSNNGPPPPPPPQPPAQQSQSNAPSGPARLVLNVQEIMNIKSKLKSVKDKKDDDAGDCDDNDGDGGDNDAKSKNDEDDDKFVHKEIGSNPIASLNKVVTKEPLSVVEMMRQEYKEKKAKEEAERNSQIDDESSIDSIGSESVSLDVLAKDSNNDDTGLELSLENIEQIQKIMKKRKKTFKKDKLDKKHKKLLKKCKKEGLYVP